MKRDYAEDIKIDKDQLEIEWEKQPTIFKYWSEKEVDAQEEKDKAERNLNVVKAKMDALVRTNPEKYDIERISEPAILNVVLKSSQYKEAEERLILAKRNVRLFSRAVDNIGEQKKRALSKLTDLWISGYYGQGGVPKEMRDKISERIRDNARDKLKKNARLKRR